MSVSIIVPVYNSEKYLRRCIDSILEQTYSAFELILINDGSTDQSGEICDTYARKDDKVKIFHKENGGVSSARNLGLENAKGDWILFVDSDDWINEDHLACLMEDISDGYDFIAHGLFGRNDYSFQKHDLLEIDIHDYETIFNELELTANSQPFSKLFRKEIIQSNNIRFPHDIHMSEDLLFILSYVSKISKMKYRHLFTYNYIKKEGSLSTSDKVDYVSNYLGFRLIVKLVYVDFEISDLQKYPRLNYSIYNFLRRAIMALNTGDYSKKQRLDGYAELLECVKFENFHLPFTNFVLENTYNYFFEGKLNAFDFIIRLYYNENFFLRIILKLEYEYRRRFYKKIAKESKKH